MIILFRKFSQAGAATVLKTQSTCKPIWLELQLIKGQRWTSSMSFREHVSLATDTICPVSRPLSLQVNVGFLKFSFSFVGAVHRPFFFSRRASIHAACEDQAAGSMEPDRFYDCWDPDVDLEVLTVQTNMLKREAGCGEREAGCRRSKSPGDESTT